MYVLEIVSPSTVIFCRRGVKIRHYKTNFYLELSHIFRRDTFGSLSRIYWYHPNTLHYIVTKQTLGSLEGTTMVCILPSTPRTYSSQGCSTTISRVAPLRSPAHDDILNNARGTNNSTCALNGQLCMKISVPLNSRQTL